MGFWQDKRQPQNEKHECKYFKITQADLLCKFNNCVENQLPTCQERAYLSKHSLITKLSKRDLKKNKNSKTGTDPFEDCT